MRTVKEKRAARARRRVRPAGQRVRHPRRAARRPARAARPGSRRSSSSTPPATRRSTQLVDGRRRPGAGGRRRDEVEQPQAGDGRPARADRRHPGGLPRRRRSKTEEQIDAELTEAAAEGVKIQLLLDTFADAEEIAGHRRRVRPRDRAPGAARRDAARSSTTTSWSSRARAAAVFGDVRRGKALALVHGAGHDQRHRRQRAHASTTCARRRGRPRRSRPR